VAIATVHGIRHLVGWNFRHLVNVHREAGFNAVNLLQGYPPISIVNPKELIYAFDRWVSGFGVPPSGGGFLCRHHFRRPPEGGTTSLRSSRARTDVAKNVFLESLLILGGSGSWRCCNSEMPGGAEQPKNERRDRKAHETHEKTHHRRAGAHHRDGGAGDRY
jgi:hypothetical protein